MNNPTNQVRIKNVTYLGKIFKSNKSKVLGHDGAYSIPLEDGRSFWTFGDTLLGPELKEYDPKKELIDVWLASNWASNNIEMIANTGCFTNTRNGEELLTTNPIYIEKKGKADKIISTALAPNRGKRYRPIWPMDGIMINKKLYIFYIFVDCGIFDISKKEQQLDINLYGVGLAKSNYPYVTFKRIKPSVYPCPPKDLSNYCEYPYIWWNCESDGKNDSIPAFGTAVLNNPINGYVYIYGSKVEKKNHELIHGVYLSRVQIDGIEDISKYEYYSNDGWSKAPENLKILFDGNANELSVSFNSYLKKYITIYSYAGKTDSKGFVSEGAMEEIHLRVSDNPEGPWSDPITIYKPKKSCPLDICYAGKEHPEFSENDGKIIYFTFVSHQRYWPELVQIEFK